LPSRGNPEGALRAYESVIATSKDADAVLCIDDDQVAEYAHMPAERMHKFVAKQSGMVGILNEAVSHHPEYDVFGLLVDDSRILTPGWDEYVEGLIATFPNRIGVVSAYHGGHELFGNDIPDYVNFPFVSKQWVEALGWFACPYTYHFCWDTVLELLGDATRIEYAEKDRFRIQHDMHESAGRDGKMHWDLRQFLTWCITGRKNSVMRLKRAMA